MSLENTTPSTEPVAAPHVAIDTSDIADEGSRLAAVMENIKAEQKSAWREEAGDDDTDTNTEVSDAVDDTNDEDTPEPVKAKAPEKAPPPAAPSAEETARKASLANAARLERESVRRSTELSRKDAELKAREAEVTARDAKLKAFEKAYNDPDELLSLLAEKVSPEKMSQWFIEQGQPEKVAARRAKAAQEPVVSEIAKAREELAALKQEIADKAEREAAVAKRQESEKQFSERVLELKADAPHAARLMAKRPKDFFAMVDTAATQILSRNPAATWDDVIQNVNKELHDFHSDLQEEAASPAAPSIPEKTGKNSAAAKAPTTVSNSAASERSVILDEDAKWESLPFAERVKRAEKRERLRG